ncbi:MAG TPA: acetyl-CoA carboxylase carboxyl transferase subunit beta, partial [Acholeplasma sp.]
MKNLLEQRKRLLMRFQEVIQKRPVQAKPVDIPDGVFTQCEQCNSAIYKDDLEKNLDVCPYCG